MFRISIFENKDRYTEAVKKVIALKEQEINEEEIPKNLSSDFQEKEIIVLLKDLKKLPSLAGNIKLKATLKISLWMLFILRVITIPIIVATMEISIIWKLLIFFASIIIVGFALYKTYKENYEAVFLILLVLFVLSIDSFGDNIRYLVESSILSLSWCIDLFIMSTFFLSFYSSWRLKKIYSRGLMKLKEVVMKESLKID